MNATFSWMLDSLQIILGFTGVPSDLLSGFLNNAFLAFELVQLYSRRDEMGPITRPSSSSMQPRRPRTT